MTVEQGHLCGDGVYARPALRIGQDRAERPGHVGVAPAHRFEDGVAAFTDEYSLDLVIAQYPKPYVAVMEGYTMGGGMGISQGGSVRIVTERTKMAMPETAIGLFPDVGGSHVLSHAPGRLGMWLGLTGLTVPEAYGGAEMTFAEVAVVESYRCAVCTLSPDRRTGRYTSHRWAVKIPLRNEGHCQRCPAGNFEGR